MLRLQVLGTAGCVWSVQIEDGCRMCGGVYPGYLPYIQGLISISSVMQSGIAFFFWEFLGPEHIWDILISSRTKISLTYHNTKMEEMTVY